MQEINIPITTLIISALSALVTTVSVSIATRAFYRQQRISRLQNIVSVFQRFSNTDDFIKLFALCDTYYVCLNDASKQHELVNLKTELESISTERKYKYLALLEEIAVFAKHDEVINETALHLFKYHFFYVYGNHVVSDGFWINVGSGRTEKLKEGWSYQNNFSQLCISEIQR